MLELIPPMMLQQEFKKECHCSEEYVNIAETGKHCLYPDCNHIDSGEHHGCTARLMGTSTDIHYFYCECREARNKIPRIRAYFSSSQLSGMLLCSTCRRDCKN